MNIPNGLMHMTMPNCMFSRNNSKRLKISNKIVNMRKSRNNNKFKKRINRKRKTIRKKPRKSRKTKTGGGRQKLGRLPTTHHVDKKTPVSAGKASILPKKTKKSNNTEEDPFTSNNNANNGINTYRYYHFSPSRNDISIGENGITSGNDRILNNNDSG